MRQSTAAGKACSRSDVGRRREVRLAPWILAGSRSLSQCGVKARLRPVFPWVSLLATALAAVLPTLGSDQIIRAEVQNARATPYSTDDPEVAAYGLKFDLRLTNRSAKLVSLPDSTTQDGETNGITVLSMQSKQPDGTWKYLFQSSLYGTRTTKYEPCTSHSPEKTTEIRNVASRLVLLKKQLTGLADEPIVRLNVMMSCRQSDGKVLSTLVTTDAFSFRLPAQP